MYDRYSPQRGLIIGLIVAAALWGVAAAAWQFGGGLAATIFFAYLGAALGVGVGIYAALHEARRPMGRRLVLFLVGSGLLAAGVARAYYDATPVQIEGLFFELAAGVFHAALLHYLLAKIAGPLIFGRIYCGWACWTAMVLDLLPFKRSPGRLPPVWGRMRYAHIALSGALVALLWYGFAYRLDAAGALAWFLVGNALYYAVGVALAFALRDNRAFCKYLCPAGAIAKLPTRAALLRVGGSLERCNDEDECVAICPMDIRVTDYLKQGARITSTECILCQACMNVCPESLLTLSFGRDRETIELLRAREVED
jgi:polyferredoxin